MLSSQESKSNRCLVTGAPIIQAIIQGSVLENWEAPGFSHWRVKHGSDILCLVLTSTTQSCFLFYDVPRGCTAEPFNFIWFFFFFFLPSFSYLLEILLLFCSHFISIDFVPSSYLCLYFSFSFCCLSNSFLPLLFPLYFMFASVLPLSLLYVVSPTLRQAMTVWSSPVPKVSRTYPHRGTQRNRGNKLSRIYEASDAEEGSSRGWIW